MIENRNDCLFFAINISDLLKKELSEKFNFPFSEMKLINFPDGEIFAQPKLSVRGKKVFIFHSLSSPVNENFMKLLIIIDACKRSSAREINLIIPYLAYSRQDRKTEERAAITSKLVSDLISNSGASRITTLDLHSDQIEGFFRIPIDHLYSIHLFAEYFLNNYRDKIEDFVIVSPDFGAAKKARTLSNLLSIPIVIMEKIRSKEGDIQEQHVYGQVNFKNCLIFDDIIGTGGTVIKAARRLKELGAKSVIIGATHGLFSGKAETIFREAYVEKIFEKIVVTDCVPLVQNVSFVEVISISKLLAQVVNIYVKGVGSISEIYSNWTSELNQKLSLI
ncbi:ribose-phosphate diphosphokinase [Candidatus Mycoplasma haematominutum]|uniref:ribose-phosphate diphosphokinase n=1 Tax=Candidatus Mycoplasma haematominutum 'Birmingham 1' TaxID=1116213 RepID=G8C2I2_9MOLU|nr:ribose-phosphate pyrophosphokinase [Candidatus Mycoplasma haematominutum]CCE66530.1 ribose-phosphate pyrophosphokinase [Candidatus Mycoplasma haematominutum 'Birmingham 1']